jgi:anti-sigma regulatory factor (Ser/Thr protein kinase)
VKRKIKFLRTKKRKTKKNKKRFKDFTKNQNKYFRRKYPKFKRDRSQKKTNFIETSKKERISAPRYFTISENIEAVLKFVYKSKKLYEYKIFDVFEFDLSDVLTIDDGAATILLSLCYDLDNLRKQVKLKMPKNLTTKKFVEQIGFRKFFKGYIANQNNFNETLKKGKSTILQKDTVPIIHKAMKTVFGIDKKNQKLQGMLIELMTNSVNHAYINNNKQKSWYISTRHEIEENKVEFCFVDNGDGIINTINVRLGEKLYTSNEEIIKKAFDGEYRSRTKLSNRGRGLIVIKNNHNKMTVKSLKVITNNVI